MSYVFGSSFQPSQDIDSENQGPRRLKRENLAPKNVGPVATKRAALGTITNQVRVQPRRAVKGKDGAQDENAFAKPGEKVFEAQEQFSIFIDNESVAQERKPLAPINISTNGSRVGGLPKAVTALRQTLATASPDLICIDDIESPMVLDSSIEDLEDLDQSLDRDAVILNVPEYAKDIYAYLREAELKNRPKPGYMKKQPDVTNSMRSILIDWLVEVSEEYKLHRETLFLAVNYIDRFLSQMSVLRGKLQLVGAASMFLASKYEEIYPPDVGEFAYITDDTYTKKQVLRMEHLVLKVLAFDVASPTTNWFAEHFLKDCDADETSKSLAMYLCELTLVDCETFLKYLPSKTAASAVCLARYSLGMEPWPRSMVESTGYDVGHMSECLGDLHRVYLAAPNCPQQAIVEKYKTSKHMEISNYEKFPPPQSLPLLS